MDLNYRRELLGFTHAQLARLLGKSIPTVQRWCSTSLEHPPWLVDWMEYVELEIACGNQPQPIPRGGFKAIEAILYPARVAQRKAGKRHRGPNGCNRERDLRRQAEREEKREARAAYQTAVEQRKRIREARKALVERAAASRARRKALRRTKK